MSVEAARVVVVEDEASVRDAVERALAREGFAVESFGDWVEPDVLVAVAPDLAVLDVVLPGGDGFELARGLRALRDVETVHGLGYRLAAR